jgi:hypothetical protein
MVRVRRSATCFGLLLLRQQCPRGLDVGSGSIVLQKSICTGDKKFCGLQARLSCKHVRGLIASR